MAFQTDQELAALVLLGGTTVNEAAWVERFPGRRRLPIFIAHGRQDGVLPFEIAERFAGKLKGGGSERHLVSHSTANTIFRRLWCAS